MPLHTLKALGVFVWEVFALHVTLISLSEAFSSAFSEHLSRLATKCELVPSRFLQPALERW